MSKELDSKTLKKVNDEIRSKHGPRKQIQKAYITNDICNITLEEYDSNISFATLQKIGQILLQEISAKSVYYFGLQIS